MVSNGGANGSNLEQQEYAAFEHNYFSIEASDTAESLAARERLLINRLLLEARFGAAVAGIKCPEKANSAIQHNAEQRFLQQYKSASTSAKVDLGAVRTSAISSNAIRGAIRRRSQKADRQAALPSIHRGIVSGKETPRSALTRPPPSNLNSKKRAHSDQTDALAVGSIGTGLSRSSGITIRGKVEGQGIGRPQLHSSGYRSDGDGASSARGMARDTKRIATANDLAQGKGDGDDDSDGDANGAENPQPASSSLSANSPFVTARYQMKLDNVKRHGLNGGGNSSSSSHSNRQQQYSHRGSSSNNTSPGMDSNGAYRYHPANSISLQGPNTANSSGSASSAHPGKRFIPPSRRYASSDDETDEGRIPDPYFSGGSKGATGSLANRMQRPRMGLKRKIPSLHQKKDSGNQDQQQQQQQNSPKDKPENGMNGMNGEGTEMDERLKNIDPRMVEMIESEILTSSQAVTWDDIAGLSQAKRAVQMAVIYPLLKPELFQGIRAPPKGLLLFGPPGTGKTLIGKCIASQAGATFFNISASSLTSKWIGEGEKMVRALFAVARVRQPTVIFIDEIDSLLTQRTDGEQEATRRIKTEFLVQLDGCGTSTEDRIILLGATNRPQELDEAARRRFPKRLYVPLPDRNGRHTIVTNLLKTQVHSLTEDQLEAICDKTDGYSGADMDTLCREAAYGPINGIADIASANLDDVRPISFEDFTYALTQVKPSVSPKDLEIHIEFNKLYGMSAADAPQ